MIEVFKTDVREAVHARELSTLLQQHFPGSRISFDLEDCDNVLRVEGDNISSGPITTLLRAQGCNCETLE